MARVEGGEREAGGRRGCARVGCARIIAWEPALCFDCAQRDHADQARVAWERRQRRQHVVRHHRVGLSRGRSRRGG